MKDNFYGDLCVIGMRGCDGIVSQINDWLKDWRGTNESFIANATWTRFGTGEGKCHIEQSMRGRDVYIIVDCFNHGETYEMYGKTHYMSPDDHFQDLKRTIDAIGGKARRINVIMPMLYEGRQHKRSSRESLDCALALQEISKMGVSNFITFDAHDARVQNAIPLSGFEDVHCTYQMLKALCRNVPDVILDDDHLTVISPDEGGISRCIFYSSILGINLGSFYKRRDYTRVVNGRNPILEHKYLGGNIDGKDVIVVDDMISSGESMLDVAKQLKEKGAKRVFVFATFGLFCNGIEEFDASYKSGQSDKVFTTNLIYRTDELLKREWYCEVNMSKFISYIVDRLNKDCSMSDLLDQKNKIKALMEKRLNSNR